MSGKDFFIRRYERLGWRYRKTTPRQAIRINTMNCNEEEIVSRLKSKGTELEKIPFVKNGYWVSKAAFSLGATTEYLLGYYSIQEAASQIPAMLFTDPQDKTVLDACAAPGGKTVQLADLMLNSGSITALDVKKQRLRALSNHLERCHAKNVIVYQEDARRISRFKIMYDRVLLDLPCSGNFVTDKEWFSRRTIQDIERNASLQKEILAEAVKILKEDGEIVYSTCSLEPEENEINIDWATRKLSLKVVEINCYGEQALTEVFGRPLSSQLKSCRRIWPGSTQGFFVCKLKRDNR